MTFDIIRYRLVLAVCLCSWLYAHPASACRYNVRETGFVDLGVEPYFLYGYVGQDTPADVVSRFKEISDGALVDSNIRFEIIDTAQEKNHPAMKLLDSYAVRGFPAAVLVSPDGQSLGVPLTAPGKSFQDALHSALDEILLSPKREEIIRQVIKAYGVVLLIEGPNAEENDKARQACAAAIEQVSAQMEQMPKPIAHAPALITLDSESFSKEKVLLWSLGLEAEKISEPYAVVLYGRARWIGPLIKGEEITEYNLASILFVIGADCECGFDYRWLQGTMLPAGLDEKLQAQIAENLGFDPEDPMVKSEMSWIIGRGSSAYTSAGFGYQEFVIEPEPVDVRQDSLRDVNEIFLDPIENTNVSKPNAVEQNLEPYHLAEGYSSLRYAIYILIGLCALVLVAGVVVLVRAKRE